MKTTTFGGGPGKVQSIHRGFDNIVHFLLVQKTNQKRTPVPFGPLGNLCLCPSGYSSGVAENLRFEEQIFFRQHPAVLRQTAMGKIL